MTVTYTFEFKVKDGADPAEVEDAIFDIIHNWYTDLEDGHPILDFINFDKIDTEKGMLIRSGKD